LLLLRGVGDVRVEGGGKQRMVVEKSESAAHNRFAVAENVEGETEARRNVVLIARKTLLNADGILRGENIVCRKIDARKRVAETDRRNEFPSVRCRSERRN
jgi:hypothetical protein